MYPPPNAIPIVRMEIEGMKLSILHAFSQHLAQMDGQVKLAVERIASPEYVQKIINDAAEVAIKDAIEAEVRYFYLYGEGKDAIKEACKARIDRGY